MKWDKQTDTRTSRLYERIVQGPILWKLHFSLKLTWSKLDPKPITKPPLLCNIGWVWRQCPKPLCSLCSLTEWTALPGFAQDWVLYPVLQCLPGPDTDVASIVEADQLCERGRRRGQADLRLQPGLAVIIQPALQPAVAGGVADRPPALAVLRPPRQQGVGGEAPLGARSLLLRGLLPAVGDQGTEASWRDSLDHFCQDRPAFLGCPRHLSSRPVFFKCC